MKKNKSNRLLPIVLAVAVTVGPVSCHRLILEDRTGCPAFLLFDLTNGEELDVAEYAFVTAYKYPDNNLLSHDTTTVRALQDKEFHLEVKHTETVVGYGVFCFNGAHNDGSVWTVEQNDDFPPIWRFSYRSPATTESHIIPVEAVKDHSVVTVRFTDADYYNGTYGEFPYYLIVRSNTCGIDGLDGAPVKGKFRFEPKEFAAGAYRFTVPRQFDRSLHLEVWGREGFREEGKMVTDIVLWDLLKTQEDFSWTAKNLADIEIEISLMENNFSVTIVQWEGETHLVFYN